MSQLAYNADPSIKFWTRNSNLMSRVAPRLAPLPVFFFYVCRVTLTVSSDRYCKALNTSRLMSAFLEIKGESDILVKRHLWRQVDSSGDAACPQRNIEKQQKTVTTEDNYLKSIKYLTFMSLEAPNTFWLCLWLLGHVFSSRLIKC